MENSNFADSSTMTTARHVNQIYDFYYNSKSRNQNLEIWKRIFDTEEAPTEYNTTPKYYYEAKESK